MWTQDQSAPTGAEQSDPGPQCQKVAKTFQQMTEADNFCCDLRFKG